MTPEQRQHTTSLVDQLSKEVHRTRELFHKGQYMEAFNILRNARDEFDAFLKASPWAKEEPSDQEFFTDLNFTLAKIQWNCAMADYMRDQEEKIRDRFGKPVTEGR